MFSAVRAAVDLMSAPAVTISIMTDVMEVEADSGGENSNIAKKPAPPEVKTARSIIETQPMH